MEIWNTVLKRQSRYKYELEEYHYLNKKQQILKEKQLTIMRKKLRLVLLNESMLWITQYKIKITEVFLITSIIKIRASVFIPTSWTEPKKDIKTGNLIQFEGDSREFTPNAVNAMRSRIEQEVVVDFYKKEIFTHANTGITTERITTPNGSVNKRSGQASTKDILCTDIVWSSDDVRFQMSASASNPLNSFAPPVDYLLTVQIKIDGTVDIQGEHDGFPCYEFYKQVNFGPFEEIHTHDFRETGDTAEALGGDMEYSFKQIL